jgi:hypothetical protein
MPPAVQAPDEIRRVMAFLRWLHGERSGYLCVNAGIADDTTPTGILMLLPSDDRPEIVSTRRWFYYDSERPDLLENTARYVLELEAAYGNVYTARTLFRSKSARQEYAVSSPIIFLDDAPREAPLPYSLYVDTGTGNGQAYYKLDTPAPKRDALRVKRALGCDPTGSADNKLLRIPGTRNTKAKHGGDYPVRVDCRTTGCYSLDRLRAAFPPAASEAEPEKERAAKPWDAEKERRLLAVSRQVKRMLTPDGLPRVVMCSDTTNQGRRIFDDPEHIASFRHPSGSWDASTVRHIRVKALILRGVTDEQAAAVVYACENPETIRIKGSVAVWNDIKGRVDYWRAQYPQIAVSAYSQRLQDAVCGNYDNTAPEVPTPRARRGRPRTTPTLDAVLARYRERAEDGRLHLGRRERAALLGISTATLDRLELVLRDRGDVTIHTTADRRSSWVEMAGVINSPMAAADVITPEPVSAERIPAPETAVASHACARGVTHLSGEASGDAPIAREQAAGLRRLTAEDFRSPMLAEAVSAGRVVVWQGTAPAAEPAPPLAQAVALTLDALEPERPDPESGALCHKPAGRKQIAAWLAERWPALDLSDLRAVLSAVRAERARVREKARAQAGWAAERMRARGLENGQLLAAVRGLASRMVNAQQKQPGSGYAKGCAARFEIYDQERRRRGLALGDAPPPKRTRQARREGAARVVKTAQALNAPRERHARPAQVDFFMASVNGAWLEALPTTEGETAMERVRRKWVDDDTGCVPPPPAPEVPTTPIYDVPGMVARLRAQQAAPPAAAAE